jgi:hypothetical protein
MRDIYTREDRLGIPRVSVPSMVGQGLLLIACLFFLLADLYLITYLFN